MRTVAAVTTSRADYGIYRPIFRAIASHPSLSLAVIVSGTHLLQGHGRTVDVIEADGFPISARVPMPALEQPAPLNTAAAVAEGLTGFAESLVATAPDILVVLGDRFEMLAAVVAALTLQVPVAHVHGGELTLGAFDDAIRHAITKMSHLHFVSTPDYARRLVQMGEEPWRITVSGAPSLDKLDDPAPWPDDTWTQRTGLEAAATPILVTYHPTTLGGRSPAEEIAIVISALEDTDAPILVTAPNVDPGGEIIRQALHEFVARKASARFVTSLGPDGYFTALSKASLMVGNTSSGILEAPSFGLPVVNIGSRQDGRVRGQNVIDVPLEAARIRWAIAAASTEAFRERAKSSANPYRRAGAGASIADRLAEVQLNRLLTKRFVDFPANS